jgi:hypothetical protein
VDERSRHARRLRAQLLSGPPARSAEAVVSHLLAVQGQDARGARLAVRSRSRGVTAADVDAGLTDRRSLVITWLNRGTLHLVAADDYWWLHPLTTPQLRVGSERRLRQEGVSSRQATRGIDVVARAVDDGPSTRAELRAALDRARVPTKGQALVHVLLAASLQGLVVRGPMIGKEHAFVSPTQWFGTPPTALDGDEALARLARRYLDGHGPATADDLARWAGIPLGDARRGIGAIEDETASDGDVVWLAAGTSRAAPRRPPPRLLGAFDPVLLGWVGRDAIVGKHRRLVTDNGLFRPFALVDGRAVATWRIAGATLTVEALEPLDRETSDALEADGRAALVYLGLDNDRVELVAAR